MNERAWFRLTIIHYLFIPILVFLIGSTILNQIYSPPSCYEIYVTRSLIYLLFIALIFLGMLFLLTAKPFDPVLVALFIGIGSTITLNALWGGLMETASRIPSFSSDFVKVSLDFAYWGLQFFFAAMTPILMLIAIKLYPKKVAFSYRYLFGLMILGVGTHITWSLVNELGIFFIWGFENFTPEIATWFPPETWILGVPWIFWSAPLSIGLILIGYWLMKSRPKI